MGKLKAEMSATLVLEQRAARRAEEASKGRSNVSGAIGIVEHAYGRLAFTRAVGAAEYLHRVRPTQCAVDDKSADPWLIKPRLELCADDEERGASTAKEREYVTAVERAL